ncbi:hypothetical protein [Inmirania thermothiophila]|uniref:Uncharacterized protein n=1 Tax=Inmirania thermothiophila TaxID=1750597 RepID=A0A3N1Y5N4_9GAMM|nr:hypothetical protein [Inmirania thermothiophila]ROR32607.1 hypothetical protein EDC57_1813 [Inmirania thermothiophila]
MRGRGAGAGRALGAALAASLLAAPAPAAKPPAGRVSLEAAAGAFVWREEDAHGRRILEERGPVLSLALVHDNLGRGAPGLIFHARAALWGGEVDYDGETQDGTPLVTRTGYRGWEVAYGIGRRAAPGPRLRLDLMATAGYAGWRRRLGDGVDARGRSAVGYVERYRVPWVRLAAGVGVPGGPWLRLGLRRDLEVAETVGSPFDVRLAPRPRTVPFVGLELAPAGGRTALRLSWEGRRWDASAPAASGVGPVFQPRVEGGVWVLALRRRLGPAP